MDRRYATKKLWAALLALTALNAPVQAETVTYLHTDLLGSVVLETDQNRNVVQRYEYEPYGLPRQAIADAPGYTGHVHDAGSGLVYMQQRYYDPEVGRFLSVDPVGVDTGTGTNFNRYWYANNNPYRFTDPDGRWAEDLFIGIPSLILGAHSFYGNVSEGNFLAAGVDAGGMVLDGLAIATPGVPGGAGLGIKAARAADSIADATRNGKLAQDIAGGAGDAVSQGPRYATGKLREQVIDKGRQADGTIVCTYCNKPTATQSDHVVPYSRGGATEIDNLVPACGSCNPSKGNKELGTEWIPPKDRGS
jgi:RHS repeat-associated protein